MPGAAAKRKRDDGAKDDAPPEEVEIAGVPEAKEPKKRKIDKIGAQPNVHGVVIGRTGSGKTWWIVDWLLGVGKHKAHPAPYDAVIILCDKMSLHQPAYDKLEKGFKGAGGVRFIEGFPGDHDDFIEKLKEYKDNGWKTICIVDDLMVKAKTGPDAKLMDMMYTGARHLNCAVWQLTQNHTDSRTRRLQCGYLVAFSTPADKRSLAWIARSINPETNGLDILDAYNIATSKPNGCLIMCLNEPDAIKFRNTTFDKCFDMQRIRAGLRPAAKRVRYAE